LRRLFVAMPVESAPARRLDTLLDDLSQRDWPVRWARPGQWHLTLKFLGDVPEERCEAVGDAVRVAGEGTAPIPVSLGEAGAFPTRRRPRVLWMGLEAAAALELLQDRIERGMAGLGFAVDGKPWRPHVTLGRVRQGLSLPGDAVGSIDTPDDAAGLMDRIVLYESQLLPSGARHVPRLTVRFDI
jgi:2'-5' RNA ligase